jgi:hypothetical protein
MANFNWNRESARSGINSEYWTNPKTGFDKAWHEQRGRLRQNLGIHESHNWEIINEPTGPHAGRAVCNTCKNKKGKSLFICWIPKGYILPNT